jgi:hypothetical protein
MNKNFVIEKSANGYIPKIFLNAMKLNIRDIVTPTPCDKYITPTQIKS